MSDPAMDFERLMAAFALVEQAVGELKAETAPLRATLIADAVGRPAPGAKATGHTARRQTP